MGTVAAEGAIVLTDLRAADGGLEELFLSLTEDTQRDDLPAGAVQAPAVTEESPCISATTAPMEIDIGGSEHVPMSRLAKVDFRKALDTRAGRWLVIAILAVLLVIEVIFSLAADDTTNDFSTYLQIAGGFLGYFLPIIIIMLVTSEASQRNGLVTFTRSRDGPGS